MTMKAAVLTASDKGAAGTRQDESGRILQDILQENGYELCAYRLVSDNKEEIQNALIELCDKEHANLILTTGGTGFSPRDNTPEATMAVSQRNAQGVAEAIRAYSLSITPRAMLSRGVSVLRGECLIVNLPGSPKAAKECAEYILPSIKHGIEILTGKAGECSRKE
ncbi:MAG: MogA/MoaB family molybdenum cofactor biosynthesis protein [Oscillospiraceae bacterium]